MKTLLFILALQSAATFTLVAQKPQNGRPLTAKEGEKWVIRWNRSDDFNGDQVDWRKWLKQPEKFYAWTWDNEKNASVSDGILKITIRKRDNPGEDGNSGGDGAGFVYTSGMLKSYSKGNYGYYEARVKGASLFPGVCPAFWLYSKIDDSEEEVGAVRYSEVDIVEMTQRGDRIEGNESVMDHNLHAILSNGKSGRSGREWRRPANPDYAGAQANEYHAPFDPREDFHTYGCRVGKKEIIWYVDGVEVGRKPNAYWHRPMSVALSFGLRGPFATFKDNRMVANYDVDTSGLPASMFVDYVRVWEIEDGGE